MKKGVYIIITALFLASCSYRPMVYQLPKGDVAKSLNWEILTCNNDTIAFFPDPTYDTIGEFNFDLLDTIEEYVTRLDTVREFSSLFNPGDFRIIKYSRGHYIRCCGEISDAKSYLVINETKNEIVFFTISASPALVFFRARIDKQNKKFKVINEQYSTKIGNECEIKKTKI